MAQQPLDHAHREQGPGAERRRLGGEPSEDLTECLARRLEQPGRGQRGRQRYEQRQFLLRTRVDRQGPNRCPIPANRTRWGDACGLPPSGDEQLNRVRAGPPRLLDMVGTGCRWRPGEAQGLGGPLVGAEQPSRRRGRMDRAAHDRVAEHELAWHRRGGHQTALDRVVERVTHGTGRHARDHGHELRSERLARDRSGVDHGSHARGQLGQFCCQHSRDPGWHAG